MSHEPNSHLLEPVVPTHEHVPERIIDEQLRLAEAARAAMPGVDVPYFAHMRVHTNGRMRDLLLGWRTARQGGVQIIDWQNAPLAEIFFEHEEGDEYELEAGGSVLTGTLVERNLVGFERGELVDIETSQALLSRRSLDPTATPGVVATQGAAGSSGSPPGSLGSLGAWTVRPRRRGQLLKPRAEAVRQQRNSPVNVELDPVQQRAVTMPAGQPVLILGEAGCGKTTVALHRLAFLARQAAEEGRRFRAAVIVPSEGLRRFTQILVERLGLGRVEVWLYDRWAAEQARAVFANLPQRESRDATAGVIRLKRHRALRTALAALVDNRPARTRTARANRMDLLHLFGDRALMERVFEEAAGGLTARHVDEVLFHTKVQFANTTEQDHTHVDADRLITIDGRSIDDGTPMQDAGSLDAEDYAVLFELDRLRSPDAPTPMAATYDCIVVDEAQELAPLELAMIGRAVRLGGSLIVAGDHAQQVDPSACFVDWATTMAELGAPAHETVTLEVSYRCPPEVTALARGLREAGRGPAMLPPGMEETGALKRLRFDNECHLAVVIIDALRELYAQDPQATAAVICSTPEAARRMTNVLSRGLDVRLALGGNFAFDVGTNVTCVAEVKGLEFDYIIVPDASAAAYPEDPGARHGLYVAMTRAVEQLVLASVGSFTPLLGP